MTRTCSMPGCGRIHASRGYCDMHLSRYKRKVRKLKAQGLYTLDMEFDVSVPQVSSGIAHHRTSVVHRLESVERDIAKLTELASHLRMVLAVFDQETLAEQVADPKPARACSVPDCTNEYFCKGLCQKHYNQKRYAALKS